MKKYLIVFVLLFSVALVPAVSFAKSYPVGCTSNKGFSSVTGKPCKSSIISWITKPMMTANALQAVTPNEGSNDAQPVTISNDKSAPVCAITIKLSKGMNNPEVKCLQKKLIQKGFSIEGVNAGEENTSFGANTLVAVKKFQTSNKLVADGIIGAASREVLNK